MPLGKTYDPRGVESKWSERWRRERLFEADPAKGGRVFSMVIPPPNVTGSLHMGHALNNTLQDALCRFHRMDGANTLWVPGTDHAGIATQNVVERCLLEEGKDRHALGRERFVERVWEWKRQAGGAIVNQLVRLGVSCDWSRERFTMDEGLSRAVREVFVRLYEEGLIYRDRYLINWCPRCRTALSDLEVEHEETDGFLYHLRYPLADSTGVIEVATTRPETMLGDTAVAVHPEDERYTSLVGQALVLPALGRRIPIIADDYVDREFGSGAVKITPGHDFNDFEIGLRHGLDMISVMDEGAVMNDNAGPYAGLTREQCRERMVEDFEEDGVLARIEPHRLAVGKCYRCRTVVEPMLSVQWFVRVRPLAEQAIEAVRSGRTRFVPQHWEKTYFAWMENIRDWCISRQLWWGHRIPAWYCTGCGETVVSRTDPAACPKCQAALTRDPDVLDTWFSSALWPFSTLGWPDRTADLETYYPTSVLVTGFDIIFFWVARMMMMGLKFMGEVPFRDVYVHALVRDEAGQKMSKSRGNVIDPLAVMDRYGTDAFRFTLAAFAAMGRDIRLAEDRIEGYRNFMNKLWNAARYVLLQLEGRKVDCEIAEGEELTLPQRWILSRVSALTAAVREAFAGYRFNEIASLLYEFTWHEFCDWYLEISKLEICGPRPDVAREVLAVVLERLLRLLHPLIPFITEEIWQSLPHPGGSPRYLALAPYPHPEPSWRDDQAERAMERVMEVIRGVRNVRAEMNIPPAQRLDLVFRTDSEETARLLLEHAELVRALARVGQVRRVQGSERIAGSATLALSGLEINLPLAGVVDFAGERERLRRELAKLSAELDRVDRKLADRHFLTRAPEEVVSKEEAKREELLQKRALVVRGLELLAEAAGE